MKNKKIWLVICLILLVYFIGGIVYNVLKKNDGNKNKTFEVDNSVQIKGFDYILYDDDLIIYKNEFNKLKKNLESSNINYLEYAHSISKMFLIDLYSLSNKKNMYNVGGLEFVYPDARDNYKLNVTNTLYKYMKDNSDGKRNQVLPTVSNVTVSSDEETTYKIGETNFEGYKLKLNINYEKDLGYDKSAEIFLVKQDKYLYVVEKN